MVSLDNEVHIWCMLSKGLNLLYVFVTYQVYVTLFYKFNYKFKVTKYNRTSTYKANLVTLETSES